jgi:rhamnogalacturonyl hydrolase YesR
MNRTRLLRSALVAVGVVAAAGCRSVPTTSRSSNYLSDWPAEASPRVIGKRVAENFVPRKFVFETDTARKFVWYPEVASWYGALQVADLTGDADLRTRLVRKFDYLRTPEGAQRIGPAAHVDFRVFGGVPLEIYMQTRDPKYLELGRSFADRQWESPTPDGITHEARYWVDDMYMIPLVQLQAYRATKNAAYLDRTALTMAAYLDRLQQPDGLFHHGETTPYNWGRGNGWAAAGLTELLRSMPRDHPRRARIMQGYQKMMAALLPYQTSEGLWRQLVDKPESWVETSGSGMFAFAMVTGVKEGWLDNATYGPAARRAWLGLVSYMDAQANIREISRGTNVASKEVGTDLNTQYKYYIDRERRIGDPHGQAPLLWTAAALLR